MKVSKKLKRISVVALAVILVLGSINLSGIRSSAAESEYPHYDETTGKYVYNGNDVLFAATHVHLFANTIVSDAHTHGNVFCKVGTFGEYGTRDEKNVLNIPSYEEVSYIQGRIDGINSASSINTLVLGSTFVIDTPAGNQKVITSNGRVITLDKTGNIYQDKNGVTAVDFAAEFAKLEVRNREWSKADSVSLDYDLTSDINNRYINVDGRNETQNVFIDIPYSEWTATSNPITIRGLDGNPANTGILVINIDMANAPANPELGLNDMTVITSNGSFRNDEYQTDQYGVCRILVNLYDSSKADRIYRGQVGFQNVFFGSILAPGATVTVGAVNGTVAADTIIHTGAESHRMDLWALGVTDSTDGGEVSIPSTPADDGQKNEDNNPEISENDTKNEDSNSETSEDGTGEGTGSSEDNEDGTSEKDSNSQNGENNADTGNNNSQNGENNANTGNSSSEDSKSTLSEITANQVTSLLGGSKPTETFKPSDEPQNLQGSDLQASVTQSTTPMNDLTTPDVTTSITPENLTTPDVTTSITPEDLTTATPETPSTTPENDPTTATTDTPSTTPESGQPTATTDTPSATPENSQPTATADAPSTPAGTEQAASDAGDAEQTDISTSVVPASETGTGGDTATLTTMTSAQTGESNMPFMALTGSLATLLAAGAVYVTTKKDKIKE